MKHKRINIILLIIFTTLIISILLLYSTSYPSSQILGKTIYKTNNGVLLTFDDGPGVETSQILDVLKEYNVNAVFFIVCRQVDEEIIKRMVLEGHTIGVHSIDHKLKFFGYGISECKEILENISGQEVTLFRPSYGFRNINIMRTAKENNLSVVTWSNFPMDYSAKNSSIIINRVLNNLESNDIITLHDGPENREFTVEALPFIIRGIQEKGFEITNNI